MRLALSQHADGVELDVRLCRSGEVIVLHDPDLERVAHARLGAANTDFGALRTHDLGGGERVPSLDEAIELVLDSGALLNVELKYDVPDLEALVTAVAQRVLARSAEERERIMFSSFSRRICALLCAQLPKAEVAFLFSEAPGVFPQGIRAVNPLHKLVDAAAVAAWHARGLTVNVWTVNDGPRAAVLAAAGVDGIITDDVPVVRAALAPT